MSLRKTDASNVEKLDGALKAANVCNDQRRC